MCRRAAGVSEVMRFGGELEALGFAEVQQWILPQGPEWPSLSPQRYGRSDMASAVAFADWSFRFEKLALKRNRSCDNSKHVSSGAALGLGRLSMSAAYRDSLQASRPTGPASRAHSDMGRPATNPGADPRALPNGRVATTPAAIDMPSCYDPALNIWSAMGDTQNRHPIEIRLSLPWPTRRRKSDKEARSCTDILGL